jgi:polyhydroxybutyrate depolymerase
MKKYSIVLSAAIILLATSCQKEDNNTNPAGYVKGKNRFTTIIDGDTREYYVHVPSGYTGNTATPVVFMLHGTSGDGEKFYNISGWREVGEDENILTVFPSSWRYCINEVGEIKNTTKWNITPDANFTFCPGQKGRNDIKFLSAINTELNAKFKIDNKRIYLAGFSNGGQMAAKCAVEMSDRLTAVAENAGSFYIDAIFVPKRKLPVLYQIGNLDYGDGNTGPAIPLSKLDTILRTPGLPYLAGRINGVANSHIRNFGLNTNYTITGDTNSLVVATYRSLTPGSVNDFRLSFVKNMGHVYPNGDNHWMQGARTQWAWFKQYSLP